MAEREIRIHNKSDRPDNVIKKENDMYLECEKLEDGLPRFLRGFFSYLKGNVLPATRLAYLHDIMFFFKYLIEETDLTQVFVEDTGQNQAFGFGRGTGGRCQSVFGLLPQI